MATYDQVLDEAQLLQTNNAINSFLNSYTINKSNTMLPPAK